MPVKQGHRTIFRDNHNILPVRFIGVVLLLFITISLAGQSNSRSHSTIHEVALIPGLVYDFGDKFIASSIHGHYLLSPPLLSSSIGVGVSVEYVFGKESHLTAGPAVSVNPWRNLLILYSMGITVKNDETGEGLNYFFSNHFEFVLEYEIGDHFHIGPTAGFNLSGIDNHISAGLHAGFEF